MKTYLRLSVTAALMVGMLSGCGNNKSKDKLLGGDLAGSSSGGSTGGSNIGGGGASSNAVANAGASQTALQASVTAGSLASTIGSSFAPQANRAPGAIFAAYANAGSGYYYLDGPAADGDYTKAKFMYSDGTYFDPNDAQNFLSNGGLTQIAIENKDVGDSASSYSLASFTFAITAANADMGLTGTIYMTDPIQGSATMTLSNFTVDATSNKIKGGSMTGSITMGDGTAITMSCVFNADGSMDGTATISGAGTITIHINADGSGTYTDATGTHVIPSL
ncbi:MAG TPA: hypothetical protein PK876_03960 [Elusimicrobiota bacterium]|nr:hypothetical protein [Elusimicrobiota bacterium]